METTFYDDPQFHHRKSMKRPVTLDLDSPIATKKQSFNSLLTSPDLHMLKLASPELERFVMAYQGTVITTSSTPTQYLFPRNVTEEQEQYVRGFTDALDQLHRSENSSFFHPQTSELLPNNSITFTSVAPLTTTVPKVTPTSTFQPSSIRLYGGVNMPVHIQETNAVSSTAISNQQAASTTTSVTRPSSVDSSSSSSFPGVLTVSSVPNVSVKEEPQTVPSDYSAFSPPLSPIDMEDQERIKLERKRYRNRIAASKCRRRKLERIARLEDKVKELKGENTELGAVASRLRDQVFQLKQELLKHYKSGCNVVTANAI